MSPRLTVARHHLETGNPQRALEVISQLDPEELQGAESEVHEIAARAYLALGGPSRACTEAKRSLEIEPTNLEALLTLAWGSYQLGDRKTVGASLSRAQELAPDNIVVLAECASILIRRGRLTKAAEFLSRATEIAPDNLIVRVALMEYAYAKNERKEARTLARGVLAERPDHVRALVVDAALATQSGDLRTTTTRLRRAASVQLGDQEAATNARRAAAWRHPVLRPAWWFLRNWWLAIFTLFMLVRFVVAASLSVRDGDLPWWSVAVPGVPVLYLVGSWAVVHRLSRSGDRWRSK